MISRRENYDYLLDQLRNLCNNYELDDGYNVCNKQGYKEVDQRIIININFCYLYCQAYEVALNETKDSKQTKNNYFELALSDNNAFNSFINNCVNEYTIYNDIGTGEVVYFPYQSLANNILNSDTKKSIVLDFLNSEMRLVISNDKKLVKKRV